MVDICFSDSVAGLLNEIKDSIESDGILPLGLHLNYGLLDCDIIEEQTRREVDTLRYFYKSITDVEIQEEYKKLLEVNKQNQNQLYQLFEDNKEMRLWISNNANDRCGLFWLCHIAKKYTNKVSTVVCPGYAYAYPGKRPYTNRNWALCDPKFLIRFSEKLHILSDDEILAYSDSFERLVKENARFRILLDDTVISTDEAFFDNIIIGYLKVEPQTQQSIMGKMLGKWQGGCDVAFISKRIEHLMQSNIIKICEEKVDENDCYWPRTLSLNNNTGV